YNHGTSYPLAMRDELIAALPYLKARYPRYADYAGQTVSDIFSPAELAGATFKRARTFATALAKNNGDGSFTLVPLPRAAQLAPVYAILARDLDGDGKTDLLVAGNFDGVQPEIGRMSAGYGLVLRGDGRGQFTPLRAAESGFSVPGQARDIQRVRTRRGDLYVVTRNNDRPLIFRSSRAGLALPPLRPDDDHAVGAAHAVQRQAGGVLDDLDRGDVARIDGPQGRAVSEVDRDVVDHIQGLVAREERADTADAHGEAAAGRARRHHAGKPARQQLLDRLIGHALDVLLRED
ncbi:MAG TPA: VCBS repeat-containing protein, partial [Gemmatimonadales bacterium]